MTNKNTLVAVNQNSNYFNDNSNLMFYKPQNKYSESFSKNRDVFNKASKNNITEVFIIDSEIL